jgi:hypothetical protein
MESVSSLSNLPPDLDAGAALADLADTVDAADLTLVGWQVLRLEHIKSISVSDNQWWGVPNQDPLVKRHGSESGILPFSQKGVERTEIIFAK